MALAYIGDEQLSWGRQAFGYHRHYYLMPALLYLKEAVRHGPGGSLFANIDCCYLNSAVHGLEEMAKKVLSSSPVVVGLSCYSWNVDMTLELVRSMREQRPDLKIVLGGPEVSFPTVEEGINFLEQHKGVDALVVGEGEETIVELMPVLLGESPRRVCGALLRTGDGQIVFDPQPRPPLDLTDRPLIPLAEAAKGLAHTDGAAVGIVYQTARGCPYNCVYCGFDGGGHRLRTFPMEKVKQELLELFEARVPLIHFADAVFDLRPDRAKEILAFCRDNGVDTSLFCYAAMQRADEQLAELFGETKTQVCIGLQTTCEMVLKRVRRKFSVDKLFEILGSPAGQRINYYMDIMFGLPGDTPDGFRQTVNAVMELDPPFVMPFPLTVVPRSDLAFDLRGYGINRYSKADINEQVRPISGVTYANIGLADGFDLGDLRTFDDVATAVFFALQRYPRAFHLLTRYAALSADSKLDAFGILEQVGQKIRAQVGDQPVSVVNPPLLDGAMRESLTGALADSGGEKVEIDALNALLKVEAGIAGIFNRPGRKEAFYRNLERAPRSIDPATSIDLTSAQVALKGVLRLVQVPYRFCDMLRLPELKATIEPNPGIVAVMCPWEDWAPRIEPLDPMESALCEALPTDRPASVAKTERRLSRLEKKLNRPWREALTSAAQKGLIQIFSS